MGFIKKAKDSGLSLKRTFRIILVVSIIVTIGLLVVTYKTIKSFHELATITENYIVLEDAASNLMSASDYLTEEAQCFTVLGERERMENYFYEADTTRRRENAVKTMEEIMPDSDALVELKSAMSESVSLMNREYYAMRLMLEALGDEDYPPEIQKVTLKAEDEKLSSEEKKVLAAKMMHDEGYYSRKNRIRSYLSLCIEDLKHSTRITQVETEIRMRRDLALITVFIIIQSLSMILMLWLATSLGINPILKAVEHIRHKQSLPIMGAREFRYLASTYNNMFCIYEHSLKSLNYKASHDELTGVYNRAGYDLIRRRINPETTAFILFDADEFKTINDEKGHEIGDKVLIKIANVLRQNFRSDDYVCRIGGDEFIVLMMNINKFSRPMIEKKVNRINESLADTEDGLPPITVSVGISYCRDIEDTQEIFHEADVALYHIKENGKNGFCFYDPKIQNS